MARLTLTGADELLNNLVRTQTRWRTMSVPFRRATIIVFASVKQNFSAGGRPGWAALKKREGQPLRDTGRLMASVTSNAGVARETHTATSHVLEIGTNVKYANAHQFGFSGTVNVRAHSRKGKPVRAHSRRMNIPARPFLVLQAQDKTEIIEAIREYLTQR